MKIRIQFKDPDAVTDAIDNAYNALPCPDGVTKEEWMEIKQARRNDCCLLPFIEWAEYCTVEIDTETKTAIVVPAKP